MTIATLVIGEKVISSWVVDKFYESTSIS